MKHKKTVLAFAMIAVVVLLAGCAPQANQIGTLVPIPPISSLIIGLLQGAFIFWVLIWNLFSLLFPIGHFDLYQDGLGGWYDLGFLIGLAFAGGTSFFGYNRARTFSRRRRP